MYYYYYYKSNGTTTTTTTIIDTSVPSGTHVLKDKMCIACGSV